MFLDLLQRRNPALLQAAADLHRAGAIPANCYVLDLDAIGRNAQRITAEASRLNLQVFAMVKQIGRNPDVSRALVRSGITHSVGVDVECTVAAASGGLKAGHVGHLVQIPRAQASVIASFDPLYWTVFNETKAREAAAASEAIGHVQDILVRIVGEGDRFYPGHEGGFPADSILDFADFIDSLPGARFAGITTFPASLFDEASATVTATPNLATLGRAAERLRAAGRENVQVNAPGTTSAAMLKMLADAGATQVEPGHGLTGTTPWHAVQDLEEEPALAYVSEVSHLWNNDAFVFGGGLYIDPVLGGAPATNAIVVTRDRTVAASPVVPVDMPAPAAIDYYAKAKVADHPEVAPGDTVLFGFRAQVFVTRGRTAAISGISSGAPKVEGIWAADGAAPIDPAAALKIAGGGHR